MNSCLLTEPHYLPNVFFFSGFKDAKTIIFNDTGLFIKQTFRNRTNIPAANGIQRLIIPVEKGKTKLAYKDVKIDNKTNWRRIHWQAIVSTYNKSPFFFYYRQQFENYFLSKTKFLFDFNMLLIHEIIKILELENNIQLLSSTGNEESLNCMDSSKTMTPGVTKAEQSDYNFKKYTQVFSDRFGFIPNMSIIDVIFNCGPEASWIISG